jgi:acyl-CoA synthetase (AMP-forming)/AMP-acid ligase II
VRTQSTGPSEMAVVDGPGRSSSLLEYLDHAAATDGTVHFVPSGEQARWSAVWREAHRCASWIARTMPGEHTLAGLLEPSRGCLVTLLGCWLSGRRFASLPQRSRGMDIDEYRNHVSALIELAEATVVVTPSGRLGMPDGVRELAYEDVGQDGVASGGGQAALIQFTSGSTDNPRGVVLDMTQIGTNARAMADGVGVREGEVFFSWLPLSHDMGLVGMCLAPLASISPELGGTSQVWLSEPRQFMRNPLSWLRLGSEVAGTVTTVPNFALELVTRKLRRPVRDLDLSALRCLIVGSETVSAPTLRHFVAATADHGFQERALCPAYGLAEATLAVTMTRPGSGWKTLPDSIAPEVEATVAEVVALGPPVLDMQVRTGPSDAAGRGEIEIAGGSVAERFLGRPGAFSADGWLRTGDLGFLHDGELYFGGRTSDRIVVAGRNLDAGSLQRRLGSVPGVRAGRCVVLPEDPHGFAVAVETSGAPDDIEMRALCRSVSDAAVGYAGARPARVLIVGRHQIPTTPSGKLQAHRLRARLDEGAVVPVAEITAARRDVLASPASSVGSGDSHGGAS